MNGIDWYTRKRKVEEETGSWESGTWNRGLGTWVIG